MYRYPDIPRLNDQEICKTIAQETTKIMDFWKGNLAGWAPAEAAEILAETMLDWQSSLARSLENWLGRESDGELILAWVNLGSLVEGFLKLFLCVYYTDYVGEEKAARKKNGELKDVDGLEFEKLRQFFKAVVWTELEKIEWDAWICHIQYRRNTVHA